MKATDDLLERIAERLKAMADPTRLKILHTLEEGERNVGEILEQVGSSQANISKHLAVLRKAGLVAARRDGMNVLYRVADNTVFNICRVVCDSLDRFLAAEREMLRRGRKAGARR